MGLQGFERRLERLVEGTFNKAFRSGLQPVEIGHRVARVLDDGRTLGVGGRPVAPNNIGVYLSPADFERFSSFADALARELAEAARQHARDEGYQFVGPVTVTLVPDDTLKSGDYDWWRRSPKGQGATSGRWCCPTVAGWRWARITGLGRNPDCTVTLADPRASRRHAEIRPTPTAIVIVDLGSMNGTPVNGTAVREHLLHDGDEISVGATVMRFEAS